jgi:importin subunit alpha-1
VAQGCIKPLCDLLAVSDARVVTVALEGLENILRVGEQLKKLPGSNGQNPYAQAVEDAEGLDKIEMLQEHQNEDLYEKAVQILEQFFDVEEGEDQNLAPALDMAQGTYAFGAPQPQAGGFNSFNFGEGGQQQQPQQQQAFNFAGFNGQQ